MGAKRPLQEEDYPELSFKQPKQLDYINKLTSQTDDFPPFLPHVIIDSHGEAKSNFYRSQYDDRLRNDDSYGMSVSDKELAASVPLSFVTSNDMKNDSSFFSSFPRYIDFSIPTKPVEQFEDPYISLLNTFPMKEIHVGPDHQAEIPQWDGNDFSGSNRVLVSNVDQNLMGKCVIPMPELNDSIINGVKVGCGRTGCSCLDVGSTRCVQQHVKEALESLRDTLGEDTFSELGFYYMGEEVACKWTGFDEQVFHEVICSNSVRNGRNFWKQLNVAFPNRTSMEIVSYYFNVFMLRRRAVQNRTYLLEIDSDDDEEHSGACVNFRKNESFLSDLDVNNDVEYSDYDRHGPVIGSYRVDGEDEEDPVVEDFASRDLDTSWVDNDSLSGPETKCKDVLKQDYVEIECLDN